MEYSIRPNGLRVSWLGSGAGWGVVLYVDFLKKEGGVVYLYSMSCIPEWR